MCVLRSSRWQTVNSHVCFRICLGRGLVCGEPPILILIQNNIRRAIYHSDWGKLCGLLASRIKNGLHPTNLTLSLFPSLLPFFLSFFLSLCNPNTHRRASVVAGCLSSDSLAFLSFSNLFCFHALRWGLHCTLATFSLFPSFPSVSLSLAASPLRLSLCFFAVSASICIVPWVCGVSSGLLIKS